MAQFVIRVDETNLKMEHKDLDQLNLIEMATLFEDFGQ